MIQGIEISDINFNEMMRDIFIMACSIARDTANQVLANLDDMIREKVDPKRYKFKYKAKKTILTAFGELTFERSYYLDRKKDEYLYLLDEFLNIELDGKVTKDVLLRMVDGVANMSYTKCIDDLKSKNIETSIGTVKNRMDDFLEKVNTVEGRRIEKYIEGGLSGAKEVKVLFEEKDGIYLKIKGSKKNGK